MYNTHRNFFLIAATVLFITLMMSSHALSQKKVDLEKEPWKEPLPEGLYILPYLQNVTQHSIVVMWETKNPIIGHVDYGLSESFGNTISEREPVTIHEITIPDLAPGTTYHYRARYGNITLDASTFKTAPPDGVENSRILVYGDARSNPKQHRKNVEQMLKFNPDIILHTGDIVARGRTYEQWQPQHFWPIQIISHKVASFAALGNHEQNSSHHFNYMSLPGNEVFFSFDYANVHIISLDSNSGATPYKPGTPQYEWLIADLEANRDAQWTFVMFHHPLFRCHPTRGIERQRYDWHPVFEKYGVDLVLSGHDHYYFRSYPIGKIGLKPGRGVRYLTTAGGGASLYPVRDRIYGAVNKSIHHITMLDIQGSRIEGWAVDSDGNEFDRFVLTKTPAPSSEYISYEIFEIEKELRHQLTGMPPIVVEKSGERISVNHTLSIPTNFEVRIEGDIVWEASDNWTYDAEKIPFVVNPGATLRIPIRAVATYPNVYPVPKMTVQFSKPIGRKEGFRNDTLTFDAIKVQPIFPVKIRKIHTPVTVDGKLNDSAWAAATRLRSFVTAQGENRPSLLFSLGLELRAGLDEGKISDNFRRAFETNGFPLSDDLTMTVRQEGSEWVIADEETEKTYVAKKEGAKLNIHRPTNGLTAMLAHDGQFLYAAARIEGDPKRVGEPLFTVDLTFQSELDNLTFSQGLRWQFEENEISLSKDIIVTVRKEGKSWRIYDADNKHSYTAKATEEGLSISFDEGYTDRDNRRILDRDEHFAVTLSSESKRLFSVDLGFHTDLDNRHLSESMRRAFESNGIELGEHPSISIQKRANPADELAQPRGTEWLIYDRETQQYYTIKNEGLLNIYRTHIYTFGVSARGAQVDRNRSDLAWNLDWMSKTVATETGWVAEMAIPIVAFGDELHQSRWRVGVSRGDKTREEVVSLAPSFTMTSLENRLPQYSYSHTQAAHLLPLSFEGIASVSEE